MRLQGNSLFIFPSAKMCDLLSHQCSVIYSIEVKSQMRTPLNHSKIWNFAVFTYFDSIADNCLIPLKFTFLPSSCPHKWYHPMSANNNPLPNFLARIYVRQSKHATEQLPFNSYFSLDIVATNWPEFPPPPCPPYRLGHNFFKKDQFCKI